MLIDNFARLQAGFTQGARARVTTWGAMTASGGRIVRTVNGDVSVLATVGDNAARIARTLSDIDLNPVTFLHPLAVAADGARLDLPRLVRAALDGRNADLPQCRTVDKLVEVGQLLAHTKPGARAAVRDVITTVLDQFGPVLIPAQVTWFVPEDHHTHRLDLDLSMGLAALEPYAVTELLDELTDRGSVTVPSAVIATLTDWDQYFAGEMHDADWETVELVPDPQNLRILTGILDAERPASQ